MFNYKTSKNLDKILLKLSRKNKKLYEQILKKIDEIINSINIEHYKNLKNDLKEFKRVHIGHFVLVFRFDKKEEIPNLIKLMDQHYEQFQNLILTSNIDTISDIYIKSMELYKMYAV